MFPKAVIDSGVLLDALVLNHEIVLQQRGIRRKPDWSSVLDGALLEVNAQRQFLNLIKDIRQKLTTSNVMAELYSLSKSRLGLKGQELEQFWQIGIDLLRQWNIDEKQVRLLDLASNDSLRTCLPRIGVTDAGLIDLARLHACVLITRDERTLAKEALERQVECRLVCQLIVVV
jgi:PIN domain